MNADEIYLVRGSDHRVRLVQGCASGPRYVIFTCHANLGVVQDAYQATLVESRGAGRKSFVQALEAVQLPATQQEVYDLPYEIVGAYVTLWCLTEQRFREEEGLLTQRPSPSQLRGAWWYVVAVREGAFSTTLQGLMRGGTACLLTGPLEYAQAWNAALGYVAGLIEGARESPRYDQIIFRAEEEPKPLPLSVIRAAAHMARHREE